MYAKTTPNNNNPSQVVRRCQNELECRAVSFGRPRRRSEVVEAVGSKGERCGDGARRRVYRREVVLVVTVT